MQYLEYWIQKMSLNFLHFVSSHVFHILVFDKLQ